MSYFFQTIQTVLIEYKSTTYGGGDAEVKEYLKDLSSFANTHGGDLVIGIEEEEGDAKKVVGLFGVDPDKERQRLENLARDGIEPRIVGISYEISVRDGWGCRLCNPCPEKLESTSSGKRTEDQPDLRPKLNGSL